MAAAGFIIPKEDLKIAPKITHLPYDPEFEKQLKLARELSLLELNKKPETLGTEIEEEEKKLALQGKELVQLF